jgi:hypothetical protein
MGLNIAFMVLPIGSTIISLGPEPNEHFNLAPKQTHLGISRSKFWVVKDEFLRSFPESNPVKFGTSYKQKHIH